MRKLSLSVVFALICCASSQATLLSHTSAAASSGVNTYTTTPISTVGAHSVFLALSYYPGYAPGSGITNNQGDTYVALTALPASAGTVIQLYYCLTPTANASYAFTVTSSNPYTAIDVQAFSDSVTFISPQLSAQGAAGTMQPGSISSLSGDLLITWASTTNASTTCAVDSGFTKTDCFLGSSYAISLGMAYLYSTGASVNPTWSINGGGVGVAAIADFRPSAAAKTSSQAFIF